MSQLDFEAEMTAHWLQSGIGPRQAAAEIQPACVGVELLSEEAIQKLEVRWQQEPDALRVLFLVFSANA